MREDGSIAMTKLNMSVVDRERLISPEALLVESFTQQILDRVKGNQIFFPYEELEFLDESQDEENKSESVTEVNLSYDLTFEMVEAHLHALEKEADKLSHEAQEILNRADTVIRETEKDSKTDKRSAAGTEYIARLNEVSKERLQLIHDRQKVIESEKRILERSRTNLENNSRYSVSPSVKKILEFRRSDNREKAGPGKAEDRTNGAYDDSRNIKRGDPEPGSFREKSRETSAPDSFREREQRGTSAPDSFRERERGSSSSEIFHDFHERQNDTLSPELSRKNQRVSSPLEISHEIQTVTNPLEISHEMKTVTEPSEISHEMKMVTEPSEISREMMEAYSLEELVNLEMPEFSQDADGLSMKNRSDKKSGRNTDTGSEGNRYSEKIRETSTSHESARDSHSDGTNKAADDSWSMNRGASESDHFREKENKTSSSENFREKENRTSVPEHFDAQENVTIPSEHSREKKSRTALSDLSHEMQMVANPLEISHEIQTVTNPLEISNEIQTVTNPLELSNEIQTVTNPLEISHEMKMVTEPSEISREMQEAYSPEELVNLEMPEFSQDADGLSAKNRSDRKSGGNTDRGSEAHRYSEKARGTAHESDRNRYSDDRKNVHSEIRDAERSVRNSASDNAQKIAESGKSGYGINKASADSRTIKHGTSESERSYESRNRAAESERSNERKTGTSEPERSNESKTGTSKPDRYREKDNRTSSSENFREKDNRTSSSENFRERENRASSSEYSREMKNVTSPSEHFSEKENGASPSEHFGEKENRTSSSEHFNEKKNRTALSDLTHEMQTVANPLELSHEMQTVINQLELSNEIQRVTNPLELSHEMQTVTNPLEISHEMKMVTEPSEISREMQEAYLPEELVNLEMSESAQDADGLSVKTRSDRTSGGNTEKSADAHRYSEKIRETPTSHESNRNSYADTIEHVQKAKRDAERSARNTASDNAQKNADYGNSADRTNKASDDSRNMKHGASESGRFHEKENGTSESGRFHEKENRTSESGRFHVKETKASESGHFHENEARASESGHFRENETRASESEHFRDKENGSSSPEYFGKNKSGIILPELFGEKEIGTISHEIQTVTNPLEISHEMQTVTNPLEILHEMNTVTDPSEISREMMEAYSPEELINLEMQDVSQDKDGSDVKGSTDGKSNVNAPGASANGKTSDRSGIAARSNFSNITELLNGLEKQIGEVSSKNADNKHLTERIEPSVRDITILEAQKQYELLKDKLPEKFLAEIGDYGPTELSNLVLEQDDKDEPSSARKHNEKGSDVSQNTENSKRNSVKASDVSAGTEIMKKLSASKDVAGVVFLKKGNIGSNVQKNVGRIGASGGMTIRLLRPMEAQAIQEKISGDTKVQYVPISMDYGTSYPDLLKNMIDKEIETGALRPMKDIVQNRNLSTSADKFLRGEIEEVTVDDTPAMTSWNNPMTKSAGGSMRTLANRSMNTLHADEAVRQAMDNQVNWVNPAFAGYGTPESLTFKNNGTIGDDQAAPQKRREVRISEAEIRRTADRVFKMVEERIRKERRRIGRI